MKKIFVFLILIVSSIAFFSCSSSSRDTSEEIVEMIETLEMENVNQNFDQDLLKYKHIGDAYYLLGEKNDYIELVMYYKQKYLQLVIEFSFVEDAKLVVDQINVKYIDLLHESYIYFDAYDDTNVYNLNDKTYDEFFIELESLSISDFEWILTTLKLM